MPAANPRELHVLLMGVRVAVLRQGAGGRLSLSYSPEWQASEFAQSLSLSLPYTQADHTHRPVMSYTTGLLPENPDILEGWAREFDVSARNPFALLVHMGEDCAGAVQFVREDRLEEVAHAPGQMEPLSSDEIAVAIRRISRNAPPWKEGADRRGMFSLAGAQAKVALAWTGDGWSRPSGRAASTHILKPPASARFPGIEANEHVCLSLARHLGIPAAASRVERFDDQVAIVVERFDRVVGPKEVARFHQEDTCQALGIPPTRKYQHDGGPGFPEMAELARAHSADPEADLQQLLAAAAFNWIIGGTDAHAKNYSWFLTTGDQVRMTPLYDLISSLTYYDLQEDDLPLAMTIGGENRFLRVRKQHWYQFADTVGAGEDDVLRYVRELAGIVPETIADVIDEAADNGLDADVLAAIGKQITTQAQRCAAILV
ncbi:MAG: type II toxin-antitoxin system HipA family toxin [Gemmatimonadota bacterium]